MRKRGESMTSQRGRSVASLGSERMMLGHAGEGESKSQITASLRGSVLPERGKDVIGGAVRS